MEYSVQQLAKLSGVTVRTIRYYDRIGLLHPLRVGANGYRIYGQAQVDALQQILFFRELDFPLERIAHAMADACFDTDEALRQHRMALLARRDRLTQLIATIDNTLQHHKEDMPMRDTQKFQGFKQQLVEENERKYGAEARGKYGDEAIDASNRRMMNLSKADYEAMTALAQTIQARLENAVENRIDPAGEAGQQIAALHRQWLSYTWPKYSVEAHIGLAQMYVDDERFTAHYDANVTGCARFLRDAIHAMVDVPSCG